MRRGPDAAAAAAAAGGEGGRGTAVGRAGDEMVGAVVATVAAGVDFAGRAGLWSILLGEAGSDAELPGRAVSIASRLAGTSVPGAAAVATPSAAAAAVRGTTWIGVGILGSDRADGGEAGRAAPFRPSLVCSAKRLASTARAPSETRVERRAATDGWTASDLVPSPSSSMRSEAGPLKSIKSPTATTSAEGDAGAALRGDDDDDDDDNDDEGNGADASQAVGPNRMFFHPPTPPYSGTATPVAHPGTRSRSASITIASLPSHPGRADADGFGAKEDERERAILGFVGGLERVALERGQADAAVDRP